MIRHVKSAAVPSSLARGVPATATDCAAFDAHAADYRSGARTFDITSGIYGTKVVKRRLKADQHGKCAFCEAVFDANVAGDVEHFRPKGAVEGPDGMIRPGYYWLGYSWLNLCYACPDCNSYRKRERFPLVLEDARALDHHDDIVHEEPLLLDTYGPRDPRDHIGFRGEAAIGLSEAGTTTIEILGLHRTELARDRLKHLRLLTALRDGMLLLEHDPRPAAMAHVAHVRATLAAAVLPDAKFSAAVADHFAALDAGENYLPVAAAG